MRKLFLIYCVAIFISNVQSQNIYHNSSIRCLGVELDGSQTLRVIGYGRNKSDAKEQAMKNAVWTVVFDGIREGVRGCDVRPIVTEVNSYERNEEYFNSFFSDKGAYKDFISLKDTKRRSYQKYKNKLGASYEMTVRVLRAQLKMKLKSDNIIK